MPRAIQLLQFTIHLLSLYSTACFPLTTAVFQNCFEHLGEKFAQHNWTIICKQLMPVTEC